MISKIFEGNIYFTYLFLSHETHMFKFNCVIICRNNIQKFIFGVDFVFEVQKTEAIYL